MIGLANQCGKSLTYGSSGLRWFGHHLLSAALELALFTFRGLVLTDYCASCPPLQLLYATVKPVLSWLGLASQLKVD